MSMGLRSLMSTVPPAERQHGELACPRCGKPLRVVLKLSDTAQNRDIRTLQCPTGHVVWDD